MDYVFNGADHKTIKCLSDGTCIPVDQRNADYQAIVASGVVIADFDPGPLADIKTRLRLQVDEAAERVRLRYITPGSGMAMTYAEKRDQAAAVHAIGEAAANAMTADQARDAYPTLAASIGVEAPTLWACAQLVIAKAEAWADLSYSIERARIIGKKAISDASDAAAAQAAYEAIAWPT